MVHPLDRIVREYAAPVLAEAGFSRRGRDFFTGSGTGDWVLVGFGPGLKLSDGLTRFGFMPAVGPAPRLRFFDPDGEPPSIRKPPRQERMYQLTRATPRDRMFGDDLVEWAFDPSTQLEACGKALAALLAEVTVPLLLRLLDREELVAVIRGGESYGAFHDYSRPADELFATVDTAPLPELEAMLRQVPMGAYGGRFHPFMRRELDARAAEVRG